MNLELPDLASLNSHFVNAAITGVLPLRFYQDAEDLNSSPRMYGPIILLVISPAFGVLHL